MTRRVRVPCHVMHRRRIATKSGYTLLARAQVHPLRSLLHTLLALQPFRMFDVINASNVRAFHADYTSTNGNDR